MVWTQRGDLSIAQLVFYIPVLPLAVWFMVKQHIYMAWIYTAALALIRIIGSGVQLKSQTDDSASLIKIGAILSSVGISPLLLVMCGLLSRVNKSLPDRNRLPHLIFYVFHVAIMLGLVLIVVGGVDSYKNGVYKVNSKSKIGCIVFVAVLVAQATVMLLQLPRIKHAMTGGHSEKRILFAVAASIPFFAVRILYSIIGNFGGSMSFNPIEGNVIIEAFMVTMEEFIIVALYIILAGFMAPTERQLGHYSGKEGGSVPMRPQQYQNGPPAPYQAPPQQVYQGNGPNYR
ncbi:MAG: hypothetical protein M1827_001707 [Pycnora praestabilis]|nr:MAG: hypothetical protein M1827_001707 [Pycnora praestabilis]